MSEKTLNQVGYEARDHYAQHRDLTRDDVLNRTRQQRLGEEAMGLIQEGNILKAEKFANNNAEQLHDLAVVEAHLDGVAINVEQPLEIGQKVEVKTPDQQ